MKYLPYVNVKMGTDSVPEFSNGNTLPLTAFPFGANHFSAETRGNVTLFFNPGDARTNGIRLTHIMSPWLGDYNFITMNAICDDGRRLRVTENGAPQSSYDHDSAELSPHYTKMHLNLYNTDIMLAPTSHGGVFKAIWKNNSRVNYFTLGFGNGKAEISVDAEKGLVYGSAKNAVCINRDDIPGDFKIYFVYSFDRDIISENTHIYKDRAFIAFDGNTSELNVRFATSFISQEQARYNLESEIGNDSYETILKKCEASWEDHLSKIEIEAQNAIKTTFYSCLYRCFLFPRAFHEICPDGVIRHFSPLSGKVCDGPFYTDNCFWDTYKTLFPLFSVILGERYREMCEGFVNFYKESGWLPRCVSPHAINCMPGTAIDAVFADAAVKGVVTSKDLLTDMLESLEKHAFNIAPDPAMGRDGISDFNKLGYVSNSYIESVNKTLDYAYGNYCISRVARALDRTELAEKLEKSAKNYQNLFDPSTGFFRARDKDGAMRSDFNDIDWGGDYTEGSAWQNTFAVYHDLMGYARLLGGRKELLDKIGKVFSTPPEFRLYGYNCEIHEMTEMAAAKDFGQCALSNQPSFHIPYLFSCMGDRDSSAYWVTKAVRELFSSETNGFPGDEDTGSMGAWYVFSCLGFYPVCPGSGEYVYAAPSIERAFIHLDNGNELTVSADDIGEGKIYAESIFVNGEKAQKVYIDHETLKKGGEIRFKMSASPSGQVYSDEDLPFSMTK